MVFMINTKNNTKLLLEDYKYAALNILWSCENGKRTVIFAFIELFPNEFPKPIEIKEDDNKLKKSNIRIYYKRIICLVSDALNWYKNAVDNKPLNMFWQKNERFEIINYEQEPVYPDFLLASDLPFLQDYIGCTRCHFLFEKNFPEEIKDLCLMEENIKWINDNLKFDISLYKEYIGALCLVAYNPLIRGIHPRLTSDEITGNESVYFEIEPRNNVDISDIKLMYIEKRNLGYKNFQEKLLNNLSFTIKNLGDFESLGYAIICPKRGLLSWDGFHGFLKGISFNMNIITGKNKVNVPNKDYSGIEETYETSRYASENFTVGTDNKDKIISLSTKLLKSENYRKQKNIAQNTQKLFYDSPKEAVAFVRELISKANEKIVIIDPYITTRELFKFALSMNPSATTTLITSSLVLKGKRYEKQAQILLNNIKNVSQNYKIEAFVMLGKEPAFHDRFIFIDNEVWISGNSLADIGKRASILIKSPSPEEIQNVYYKIINDKQKIIKLEEWINNHGTASK